VFSQTIPLSKFNSFAVQNTLQKGPSYWKCNVKILADPDLCADLDDVCINCMQAEIKDEEWYVSEL